MAHTNAHKIFVTINGEPRAAMYYPSISETEYIMSDFRLVPNDTVEKVIARTGAAHTSHCRFDPGTPVVLPSGAAGIVVHTLASAASAQVVLDDSTWELVSVSTLRPRMIGLSAHTVDDIAHLARTQGVRYHTNHFGVRFLVPEIEAERHGDVHSVRPPPQSCVPLDKRQRPPQDNPLDKRQRPTQDIPFDNRQRHTVVPSDTHARQPSGSVPDDSNASSFAHPTVPTTAKERIAAEFMHRNIIATPGCVKCKVCREGVRNPEGMVVNIKNAEDEDVALTAAYVAREYPRDPENPNLIPKLRNAANARGCCYWAHSVSLGQLWDALSAHLGSKKNMKAWRRWILAFMTEEMGVVCHGAKYGNDKYDRNDASDNQCSLYDAMRGEEAKPVAVDPKGNRSTQGGNKNTVTNHHFVFMGYQLRTSANQAEVPIP